MIALKQYIPLATVSEANQREHWAKKHRRKNEQQMAVMLSLPTLPQCFKAKPLTIILTRYYSRRPMDTDNLAGSFKHVRDAIAKWLKVDDGDGSLRWEYAQVKNKVGGIEIEISPTGS